MKAAKAQFNSNCSRKSGLRNTQSTSATNVSWLCVITNSAESDLRQITNVSMKKKWNLLNGTYLFLLNIEFISWFRKRLFQWRGILKLFSVLPGGVLVEIFGGGVPPTSPNPDPISDQKMLFPTPVFRPGLKNPYPFSDLSRSQLAWPHLVCD